MIEKSLFLHLSRIAVSAGNEIMKIYSGSFNVEMKEDNSPLTAADKSAHDIILKSLLELEHNGCKYPVISEEGLIPVYKERKNWEYFWLVDPLDGTKEFISRNGEFTVNIALIQRDYPILGVVYIPVQQTIYFGGPAYGSYKTRSDDTDFSEVQKLPLEISRDQTILTAAGSRSHRSREFEAWVSGEAEKRGCSGVEVITAGSSLKFCLAAEGEVDVYPRFGPTMEWDTAAAHAVVEGAGKACVNPDGSRMKYNKPEMRNNGFIVL